VKRTKVDPKKLKLKRKAIVAISEKKLEDVSGGCHGGKIDPNSCGSSSRYCTPW
jgi:hypothetical protein